MVTLSTFDCSHNVYVSVQSFRHCRSCVRTPLVGCLGLWPCYVYKFPDARYRPWLLLSDGFYTYSTMSRGGRGSIRAGKIAESWCGWHSVIRKDHPLVGIHICPCLYQEETETRSFHYTNSLIGDIAMVISVLKVSSLLAVRPLSLSRPTMNTCTGRPNGDKYPQSSTNRNWRSTGWLFKPESVKIQANFLGIGIV